MPATDLLAARSVSLILLLALAGVPLYLRISGQKIARGRFRAAMAAVAFIAALASLWWAAASVAAMTSIPVAELDRTTLTAVLNATPLGAVLTVKLAALVAICLAVSTSARLLPVGALGLAALASNAWTGHAGAGENSIGSIQKLFDVIHLGAAAIWFGALLSLLHAAFLMNERDCLSQRLSGFAATGTLVVILLAITGTFNAWAIISSGWEVTSGWTMLFAAKLALFGTMLCLAALNRWRLTPALAQGKLGAEKKLRVSLVFEMSCAIAIFLIVAVFGMLDPAGT